MQISYPSLSPGEPDLRNTILSGTQCNHLPGTEGFSPDLGLSMLRQEGYKGGCSLHLKDTLVIVFANPVHRSGVQQ